MKYSLFSLLFLAISCGPVIQQPQVKFQESYEEESTGEPFILKYDSRECNDSGSYLFKLFTEYSTYKNIEFIPPKNNESGIFNISKKTLLKKEMLFGGTIINRVTLNTRNNKISTSRVIKKSSDKRNLCVGKDYSDTNTLDAVGVKVDATMAMVESAIKQTSLPKSLRPITIRIHPKYVKEEVIRSQTRKRTKARSLINNALFNYEHNEMVILAQGKNTSGLVPFNGIPLWDLPIVTAHEYGHYVLSALYPNYFQRVAPYKISRAHLCYDNHVHGAPAMPAPPVITEPENVKDESHEHDESEHDESEHDDLNRNFQLTPVVQNSPGSGSRTEQTQRETQPVESGFIRKVDEHTLIGALNEGFADLFARYTLGDEYTVNGVGCLSQTRDVYSAYFLNGEHKKLTRKAIDTFLSSIKSESKSCFSHTNYQSLHVIGAILAHGVDKIYKEIGLNKNQKLKQLVKWARSINRSHSHITKLANEDVLNYYAFLAFDNVMNQFLSEQVKIKKVYEENFPLASAKFPL